MDREDGYRRAEARAFRLLTLRAHSERELRAKLEGGGHAAPLVDSVVQRCRELGYLDDGVFARQRARMLAAGRLAGDRRIAHDLRERGIDPLVAAQAIAEVRAEIGEQEAAARLLQRKTRGVDLRSLTGRQKAGLARSLARKGFPTGLIIGMLKEIREEGFDGDDGE